MKWKRTAVLGIAGGALATLIARASMLSVVPAPPAATPQPPIGTERSALVTDIARLRERQRRLVSPTAPSRNLFEFRPAPAPSPRTDVPRTTESPAAAAVRSAPAFALVGLAEESGQAGATRTAIVSGPDGLHFVKTGDSVAPGYRVTAVREDRVELSGPADTPPVVLRLK